MGGRSLASLLALLLAVAPQQAWTLLSSAGPEDLLATPRYVLSFSGAPVSNASAAELLVSDDGRARYHRLRSTTGQAFVCSVPQPDKPVVPEQTAVLDDRSKFERQAKREQDRKAGLERGLALLEPLKGTCLHLRQGWFTYSFCHGEHIRQYHETRTAAHQVVEDVSSESYTLGQYGAQRAELSAGSGTTGALRDVLASRSGLPGLEDDSDGQRRYLVQRWSGGTICDKTGMERKVEVQFHCHAQNVDRIALIREVSICEYTMVIHTPRLCGEPIFHGGVETEAHRNAANVIRCNPIAGDGPARPAPKIDAPVEPVVEPPITMPPIEPVTEPIHAFQVAIDPDQIFDDGEEISDEELLALADQGLTLTVDTETGDVIVSDPPPPAAEAEMGEAATEMPAQGAEESSASRRKKQMTVLEQISSILEASMKAALKDAQQAIPDDKKASAGAAEQATANALKSLVDKLQAAGHQATILSTGNGFKMDEPPSEQFIGSSRQFGLAQAYAANYGSEAEETKDDALRQEAPDAAAPAPPPAAPRRDEL